MGPIDLNPTIWPPVEPAARPSKGDLALNKDKDRRSERHMRRREHQDDQNPDGDEFTPSEEEP